MDYYLYRIKPLFSNSGKTNADLEREIGIPPKKIYQWNKGHLNSYQKYIPQIAEYFGVSTDYLLGKTDDPAPPGKRGKSTARNDGGRIGPNKRALLDMVETMSEDEMAALLEVIKAVKKMGK